MIDVLKSLNLFDRLIVEHGGSVIFKEHISLLKEQMLILDSERKDLQIQNKDLQIKINDIEKEINIAKNKNTELQRKINDIHNVTLSEKHEKVLITVASYSGQHAALFADILKISELEAITKLNYLSSLELLHYREAGLKDPSNPKKFPKPVQIWFVSKLGHAYIKAHNMNDKIA